MFKYPPEKSHIKKKLKKKKITMNSLTRVTGTPKRSSVQAFDLTIIPTYNFETTQRKKMKTVNDADSDNEENDMHVLYCNLIERKKLVPIVGKLYRCKRVEVSETVLKTKKMYDTLVTIRTKDAVAQEARLIDEINMQYEFERLAKQWVQDDDTTEEGEVTVCVENCTTTKETVCSINEEDIEEGEIVET